MAPTRQRAAGELPRPLLAIGVPCAGVLLIAFFLIRGFPYDQLGARIVGKIEHSQGVRLTIGELVPVMRLAGPALEATGVRATLSNGEMLQIDRTLIRAAWSTSWLTGDPAVHVELESPVGAGVGTLEWNGSTAWNGTVSDVAVSVPPLAGLIPVVRLDGELDATVDVRVGELETEGLIQFQVRDGSLTLPNTTVALPFELLHGELELGGDGYVTLESVEFEGSVVSGTGSGAIAHAESFGQAPVSIELDLEIQPALTKKLRAAGIRVSRDGPTKIRLSGTVDQPTIR
jgi:type II secretion system protein N